MVISQQEAWQLMQSGHPAVILDVRDEFEFEQVHIPGAMVIPFTELERRAEDELPEKDKTILVYCRSGRRSAIAAETLEKLGYTDIRDFGGIIDWKYDVEREY
ncbi:MAG: rhodanese-like domain-containing protein [Clostridia bacterium]|nr:rhodanese-like domain-containing protein [Clostridia bacterium]